LFLDSAGSTENTANEIAKQQTTPQLPDIPSIITVDVLGYGEGSGKLRMRIAKREIPQSAIEAVMLAIEM
jgi:hypothetical protein